MSSIYKYYQTGIFRYGKKNNNKKKPTPKKTPKQPYSPIQLIITRFEHFILHLCNINKTQANSSCRTAHCKYTHTNHEIKSIIQKEAMCKSSDLQPFNSYIAQLVYLYIRRVKQSLRDFQTLSTKVTVIAIRELIMNCRHLCCYPGASARKQHIKMLCKQDVKLPDQHYKLRFKWEYCDLYDLHFQYLL